jgi:fatty-acyl-CoA synthase
MAVNDTQFRTITEALAAAPGDRLFAVSWIDEDEHEDVTFEEFRRRARLQATVLHNHGVGCGDRVIIVMPQSIAAMASFVGAMMLGAVPAFLAYPNFKVEPAKYRYGLAGVTANLSAKIVLIDEDFPDELLDHVSLGDGSELARAARPAGNLALQDLPDIGSADNIAFIQHSAGTTGLQKGVALTHAAVLRQIAYLADALHINSETDRIYSWLPLYHDMGLIACFILPIVCHIPVVMQSPLDWVMHPETMLQLITDYRCTLAWIPNFGFQFLSRRTRPDLRTQYDLSSLRALINCSEPVRAESINEFRRAFGAFGLKENALQSCYAMAENVFAITQSDLTCGNGPRCLWVDGTRFRREHRISPVTEATPGAVSFVSSGQLLPGHEVRILSDSGSVAGEGTVGEILIKSDCLFQGYYNRPDLTQKTFLDGWHCTGDLGFWFEDELFVVGRKKDLLIIGGENLYPQDIEEIASTHPDIHDGRVVAIGIYNPDLGTEEIVIVAEAESEEVLANSSTIEADIRRRVVAGLGVAARAVYVKPPRWIVKSTAGKPARSTTREKLLREHPELNYEAQEGSLR